MTATDTALDRAGQLARYIGDDGPVAEDDEPGLSVEITLERDGPPPA
jgi:hypothetical protein